MFDYFHGVLTSVETNFIVIDIQGVGYKIFVPESWLVELRSLITTKVRVFVSLVTRELEQILYGFKNKDLRNYFNILISVSGIGPKIALSILSLFSCQEIVQAVQQKNASMFSFVSGIGKKTAEKLILDLEGKLPNISSFIPEEGKLVDASCFDDALSALTQLGYAKVTAEKLLRETFKKVPKEADLPTILKEALRKS